MLKWVKKYFYRLFRIGRSLQVLDTHFMSIRIKHIRKISPRNWNDLIQSEPKCARFSANNFSLRPIGIFNTNIATLFRKTMHHHAHLWIGSFLKWFKSNWHLFVSRAHINWTYALNSRTKYIIFHLTLPHQQLWAELNFPLNSITIIIIIICTSIWP